MKRFISLLLIVFCVMSAIGVYADEGAVITLDSAENDGKITVSADISDNPGFAGFLVFVKYDNTLVTPVSMKKGVVFNSQSIISNIQQGGDLSQLNEISVFVISPSNIMGDGELFSITFNRVKGNDAVEFDLVYDEENISNEGFESVPVKIINNTKKKPVDTYTPPVISGGGSSGGGTVQKPVKPPVTDEEETPKQETKPVEQPTPSEQPKPVTFTDVAENDWFYGSVKWGFENGLVSGVTATEFAPYENVTRAMLVTMLYRYSGEVVSYDDVFTDLKFNEWYYDPIMWAYKNNIVNGIGNGLFAPNNSITREQAAKILYEYAKAQNMNVEIKSEALQFADSNMVSDWAYQAMLWAVDNGYLKGRSAELIAPQGEANRAEIITVLQRVLQK